MEGDSRLPWLIAAILLLVAFFFAAAETALSSASRTRLKTLADSGNAKAEDALSVLDEFDRAITTILIGTNIVHITIATIITVAVTERWGVSAVTVSTIITTLIVFFAGEMLPKSIAKKYPETISMGCAATIQFFMVIFKPFAWLLTKIGQGVSNVTAGEPELSVTEDELYDIIEDMTEEGALDEEQGELISAALDFADVTVESILTPRVDLVAIDCNDSLQNIMADIKSCNHSRLPVYENSIDNIIGILQIRKFIKAYMHLGDALELKPLLDEPMFVHQSTNVADLLPVMSRNKQNIAVVTDNYGGTLGIVTIEDMLEELVGEIWDEDDVVEENIVDLRDGKYSVSADEHAGDVFAALDFEDPEKNEQLDNTVMGAWALEQFPQIPTVGESFDYHGLIVTVEQMEHNRIRRLTVSLPPREKEADEA